MSGIITRKSDHDLAGEPRRKSNSLEYRPFMVNSQNSAPLQHRHSWDAGTGAILDTLDKRIAAFVFMGRPQSNLQYVLFSDSPRMVSARKNMDIKKVEQTMQDNAWADPGSYVTHLGPAPALFQYGLHDEEWVPLVDAKDYFAMSSGPKEVKFYDSGHALNAQARLDRFEFLHQHLALLPLSPGSLESIPDTK